MTKIILALLLALTPACAADIHVMISGGLTAAYDALAPEFERKTGHHLITVHGSSLGTTPTAIPVRLSRGEVADVVIAARKALDTLAESGKISAASIVDVVHSPIALAVRDGAPLPDISTVDGLRRTLLAAKSIAYSDSASGIYISTQLFKKLGIEEIAARARKIDATPVGAIVAKGDAEIGFQQLSELLPVKGITIVGAIPAEVQSITTFSAGLTTTTTISAAAQELIRFLRAPEAEATLVRTGVTPVR